MELRNKQYLQLEQTINLRRKIMLNVQTVAIKKNIKHKQTMNK